MLPKLLLTTLLLASVCGSIAYLDLNDLMPLSRYPNADDYKCMSYFNVEKVIIPLSWDSGIAYYNATILNATTILGNKPDVLIWISSRSAAMNVIRPITTT